MESMIALPFDVQTLAPSRCGSYKLNFDAAVFNDSNIARIEIIARDWRGKVIVALLQSISVSHLVADMELKHVEELSSLLLKLGFVELFLKGIQLWRSMLLLKEVLNFLPMETSLMTFAALL